MIRNAREEALRLIGLELQNMVMCVAYTLIFLHRYDHTGRLAFTWSIIQDCGYRHIFALLFHIMYIHSCIRITNDICSHNLNIMKNWFVICEDRLSGLCFMELCWSPLIERPRKNSCYIKSWIMDYLLQSGIFMVHLANFTLMN